jgi:hypothetical protein
VGELDVDLNAPHHIQFLVHCYFLRNAGAVLAVESRRVGTDVRTVTLTWKHDAFACIVWQEILTFVERCLGLAVAEMTETITLRLVSYQSGTAQKLQFSSYSDLEQRFPDLCSDCDYFEIELDDVFKLWCDVSPFESDFDPLACDERQIAVSFPVMNWDRISIPSLRHLFALTSDTGIPKHLMHAILDVTTRRVELPGPRGFEI